MTAWRTLRMLPGKFSPKEDGRWLFFGEQKSKNEDSDLAKMAKHLQMFVHPIKTGVLVLLL
jgi:hypothetical protein